MLTDETWKLVHIFMGEFLGTALILYFGCMGSVKGFQKTPLDQLQGPIVFGFTVCTVIVIFAHISGAHFNPAVTVAAIVLKGLNLTTAVVYVIAQLLGACMGFGLLKVITPCEIFDYGVDASVGFCGTSPHPLLSLSQALLAEFLATCFLVFVVCSVWDTRNGKWQDSVAIKFAFTICLLSIVVGPYTGASMNPARTLAPAIFNNVWTAHWIYWVGPLAGGFVTAVVYKNLFHSLDNEDGTVVGGHEDDEIVNIKSSINNSDPVRTNGQIAGRTEKAQYDMA